VGANLNVPSELFAGDSATWEDVPTKDRLGGAIDSTWTLKFVFGFASAVTITSTTNGSGWTSTISKAQTAVTAGDYYWQAYAETGSRRETIGRGRITIKPASASAVTGKSQTQQDLEAVQLAMRNMISGGAVQEYTIGGRSMRKMTMADLVMWEGKLKVRLARERAAEDVANGLGNPKNAFVRFK
jgi:hypothetical protein